MFVLTIGALAGATSSLLILISGETLKTDKSSVFLQLAHPHTSLVLLTPLL